MTPEADLVSLVAPLFHVALAVHELTDQLFDGFVGRARKSVAKLRYAFTPFLYDIGADKFVLGLGMYASSSGFISSVSFSMPSRRTAGRV